MVSARSYDLPHGSPMLNQPSNRCAIFIIIIIIIVVVIIIVAVVVIGAFHR